MAQQRIQPDFTIQKLKTLKVNPELSTEDVNNYIKEVFGRKANNLVFSNQQRYKAFSELLTKRYYIIEKKERPGEKLLRLSEVPLNNKYNNALERNISFNPYHFNPLKYQLEFFTTKKRMYRVDQTNYVVVLLPSTIQ